MSYSLENEFVRIDFCKDTGAITGLLNRKTGWQVIRQPKLSIGIRMLVPVKDYRNNKASSEMQKLSTFSKPDDNIAVLEWGEIACDRSGVLDITVKLTAKLEGHDIYFEISIDNRSGHTIEEVWCPCLGGLRGPVSEPILQSMSFHMWAGANFTKLGDGFPQSCGYWGVDHPTVIKTFPEFNNQTPFIILTNGIQGIYLGMHDKELNIVNFVHELKPGYIACKNNIVPKENEIDGKPAGFAVSAVRMPFIQPGERMTLAPMVLSMFEGTWHNGLKPYQEWRKTWFAQSKQPAWLNKVDCWMTLHINSPEGCCRYKYNELPEVMRETKLKGVQVLQLIGWARNGQDGAEPYQDIDPRLGTEAELRQAIKEIEAMGIRVLLMCKFKWADRAIPEFEKEMHQYTLKDMYGNYVQFNGYSYQTMAQQLNGGSRRCGAGLCHLPEGYRRIALREFEKILDLGSSGILYDELSNNMSLCFDGTHGHRPGECNFKGSMKLAEDFYRAAQARNPEFLMAGEGTIDPMSQFYPVTYVRTWNNAWLDEGEHVPAWKYMNPDMKIATCLIGWDDREIIHQAIAYGYIINYEPYNFKGRLSDFPGTVEYGMKAQKLRKRLWDYIWDGKFTHTVGANVEATDAEKPEFIYTVFENRTNGKKAVVVANQDSMKVLSAKVMLDGGNTYFAAYNMDNDEIENIDGVITIPSRSLVILVEN